MKLIGATGDVIVDIDNSYLVQQGYSAKPIVHIVTIESAELEKRWWKADYQLAYDALIVNNNMRNTKIASFAMEQRANDKSVLVLVNRLDHGEILKAMIPGSVFVHGSHDTAYRKQVLDHMRHEVGVYIASPIFDEGIDIPALDAVVIAAGGKSQVKLLQRIGRGMRCKPGNDNIMLVLDFIDDTNQYLLEHSNDRIDTYIQEKFTTRLR
jgi:superfamily II DNA or RNA helicase